MESAYALAGWLALHVGIGWVGTWLARRYALHRRLLDEPGERRSHAVATPRGGGIAIVVAMLVALLAVAWMVPAHAVAAMLAGVGLAAVAAVGWIDDHQPLSPWWRLATHAVAALFLAAAIREAGGGPWQLLSAFVAVLVLVNVWNFMDGIDGLAATQAVIVAAGYALFQPVGALPWLGMALAAATLGFLPFNVPKARIFLGDVGSGALGYCMAGLLTLSMLDVRPGVAWMVLLLPLSAFLVDAALTLCSRILRRERWWEAHVQHAYQHWVRITLRHMPVTIGYATMTVACTMAMFASRSLSAPLAVAMIAAVWLAGGGLWWRSRSRRSTNP